MESLADRLKAILVDALADGLAELETLPNGHVSGDVVSSEFKDQSYEGRRQRIRQVLDKAVNNNKLTAAQLQNVSTLLTFTPEEWSVKLEEI